MSFQTGTATDVGNLMALLNTFLALGHSLDPIYAGTGNGTITLLIGTGTSVLETITVTLTSATAFSVSGSVSGALGTGTVGSAFTSSKVNFTLVAGGTAWVNGDTVSFVMTPPWSTLRAASIGSGNDEYVWQAPGNDGATQIYVGAQRFTNLTGDYDNVRVGGFTGYTSGNTWLNQPGAETRPVMPGLRVGSIPYWFIANGRRAIVVAKMSTVYECLYLGFINPYASPSQYPYPLAVGGSMAWQSEPAATSTNWRWSYQGVEHSAFPMSRNSVQDLYDSCQLRMRDADGTWRGFEHGASSISPSSITQGYLWPYSNGMTDWRPNLDGSYSMFPILLSKDTGVGTAHQPGVSPVIFGELDGVVAVTGFGNSAENTITLNRIQYLVVPNTYLATEVDYFAVKLS